MAFNSKMYLLEQVPLEETKLIDNKDGIFHRVRCQSLIHIQ